MFKITILCNNNACAHQYLIEPIASNSNGACTLAGGYRCPKCGTIPQIWMSIKFEPETKPETGGK